MSLDVCVKKKLDNFSLDVEFHKPNGVMGMLGASGCGKSMTLQMIAGIVKPDSGYIALNGKILYDSVKKIDVITQKRKTGYLFQNYALFPNMTVAKNIACGIRDKIDKKQKEKLVRTIIADMHLEGLEKRRPGQLSGGQQQRVALGRVLIGDPDILLLDEPFSALDSHLKEQLVTELAVLLRKFGKDVLLVSHSRDEVYELCDYLTVMNNGTIAEENPTKEVFAHPRTRAGAILTGCKNVANARKAGEFTVEVPEWGIRLQSERKVEDGLRAVGVRAHYFAESIRENAYSVRVVEKVEEPFAWIIKFRYDKQNENSAPLWWRISKDKIQQRGHQTEKLGILSKDVMLLYD